MGIWCYSGRWRRERVRLAAAEEPAVAKARTASSSCAAASRIEAALAVDEHRPRRRVTASGSPLADASLGSDGRARRARQPVSAEIDGDATALAAAAAAAAASSEGKRAQRPAPFRRRGGRRPATAANTWALPLAPNRAACAELLVLCGTLRRGLLRREPTARWTLAVTHSPCTHCASTVPLFAEVRRVAYGLTHTDAGLRLLQDAGVALAPLNDADRAEQRHQKRPRPVPAPSAVRRVELRDGAGAVLAEARDVPNVRAWLVDAARGGARVGDGFARASTDG